MIKSKALNNTPTIHCKLLELVPPHSQMYIRIFCNQLNTLINSKCLNNKTKDSNRPTPKNIILKEV